MYYVIIDLEWNQYHNPMRTPVSKDGVKMHEEIIQIGAVKTDKSFTPVDTFSVYVRLGRHRRLDKYVSKLTHITERDIACGEDFGMAAEQFASWLGDTEAIFSWGQDDRRVFLNNLAFYGLEAPACAWFDGQKIFAAQTPNHGSLGLQNTAAALGLRVSLTLHDAMNDAILTSFCMRGLDIEKGIRDYSKPKAQGAPCPLSTAKTHRHTSQQAAWEEAVKSLMNCPECMRPLEWCGEETGSLALWHKPARCQSCGGYIIRGEFMGIKSYTVKFSYFKDTPENRAALMGSKESTSKKCRRRRKAAASAPKCLSPEEILSRAIAFAAAAHKEQHRKGSELPYIVHPMEAAAIAATMTDDPVLMAACVLHDTLEDCQSVTEEAIETEFGAHVAELVKAETEDKTGDAEMTWQSRKQTALDRLKNADEEQLIVALSDKLSNLRQIARDYKKTGDEVWQRFNQKDKKQQAWYYRELLAAFKPLEAYDAYEEFSMLVKSVFGAKRTRKKQQ